MPDASPVPAPTIALGSAINFSKDAIWITSQGKSTGSPADVGFGFLHLYVNFCCRVLVNATKDEVRNELLARYQMIPENEEAFASLGSCYQYSLVNDTRSPSFGLFGSLLELREGEYGPHGYQLMIEGFGFRTRKAEDNTAPAATALTAWLIQSQTSWGTEQFRACLVRVGPRVADLYRQGALDIRNQHEVAQSLTRRLWVKD